MVERKRRVEWSGVEERRVKEDMWFGRHPPPFLAVRAEPRAVPTPAPQLVLTKTEQPQEA